MMGNFAFSQIGIGIPAPDTNSDLDLGDTSKALYLNRISNPSVINDPQPGMIIYDVSEKCVKAYQDDPPKWSDCMASLSGAVSGFTCGAAAFIPSTANQGAAYSGVLTIPYTGGNGGTYAAQSFTQNGLTFTLTAGNFSMGAGNLVYNINGTGLVSQTMSLNLTAGGQSCKEVTFIVNP